MTRNTRLTPKLYCLRSRTVSAGAQELAIVILINLQPAVHRVERNEKMKRMMKICNKSQKRKYQDMQ
jgi:hypothetical protein